MPVEAPTGARVVVVSPHSDDGVLSLGALMARLARRGRRVELLTVLGLDPDSKHEAGGWDRRAGFSTEGEAARARRDEDAEACAILGVTPSWLPFGSSDYERHADDATVWNALSVVLRDAAAVLVPGWPLTHPDHRWISDLLGSRVPPAELVLYAEQPYTARAGESPFAPARVGAKDRLAKWHAVRAYRSQLPLLAMRWRSAQGPMRLALASERTQWPEGLRLLAD